MNGPERQNAEFKLEFGFFWIKLGDPERLLIPKFGVS